MRQLRFSSPVLWMAFAATAASGWASPQSPESCPMHGRHAAAGEAGAANEKDSAVAPSGSPYEGQEAREIKALSPEEVAGYLEGKGLGLARAAELNHYPGPKHVLELATDLSLSAAQRRATESLYAGMKNDAMALGRRLVDLERALEGRFAKGTIDEAELRRAVAEIAQTQGELRIVHLRSHLAQVGILSVEQRSAYDRLRGYGRPGTAAHSGH